MINYPIFSIKSWSLLFDMLLSLDWWNWNTAHKVLHRSSRCKTILHSSPLHIAIPFKTFGVRAESECMKTSFPFWPHKTILLQSH